MNSPDKSDGPDRERFDMAKPLPDSIVADFPVHLQPYANAGRLRLLDADVEHYRTHRHAMLTAPACLASWIGKTVGELTAPTLDHEHLGRLERAAAVFMACRLLVSEHIMSRRQTPDIAALLSELFPNAEINVVEEKVKADRAAGFQKPKTGQA